MNIAVILAGGTGNRVGSSLPKQFLKIAGKKVIEHTITVFENNKLIDEIVIVSEANSMVQIEQLVITNQFKKVKKILIGGKERYHSSLAAINAYDNDNDNLIFHDAVRPLVNNRIINDCILALQTYEAVDVAIPTTDTIIQVNKFSIIENIPIRSELRNGQTPQCFKRKIIKEAYDLAQLDPEFTTTDDCGVIRKYMPEIPIFVVPGETFNMKLTYQEDVFLLDKLFQLKSLQENGDQISDNALKIFPNKVIVVFGGSYGIGKEIVDLSRELGSVVYSFSRSQNGVDVSNANQVSNMLKEIIAKNGKIDYVISTAGILVKESLNSLDYSKIQESINVNYLGVINVAKESFQFLKESRGSILFFTSSSYTKGRMLYSVYSSTKAAIVNLVQALSDEWSEFGITVNCINPERTKTPMRIKNFGMEDEDSLLSPKTVAIASINILASKLSGEIIDVRK